MCTSIWLDDGDNRLLAQNYDFYYGHGLVIGNPAGLEKVALGEDEQVSARWTSRFRSLTFNQFARELPVRGMNSEGLAVASMWHDGVAPTPPAGSSRINELQWIQHQLDRWATVDQVVDHLDDPQLQVVLYPMHYLIADRSGRAIIVEHDSSRFRAVTSPQGYACSNAGFRASLDHASQYQGRASADIRLRHPILDRAAKALLSAREFARRPDGRNPVEHAFSALEAVRLQPTMRDLYHWIGKGLPPTQTYWQIAFDVSRLIAWFRTPGKRDLKQIRLADLPLGPGSAPLVLNYRTDAAGDVTSQLVAYTRDANAAIVHASFRPLRDQFSEEDQQALIEYPERFSLTVWGGS